MKLVDAPGMYVAFITCPDEESGNNLATKLVEQTAAACVNIVPGLTSVYRWQGEVCRDREILLVVKTTQDRQAKVASIVDEHHPYDEPELIFLPMSSGSSSYLSWLQAQTLSAPVS